MGEHIWGLTAPKGVQGCWSARAIECRESGFSLVWNRQCWPGLATSEQRNALARFINGYSLRKAMSVWTDLCDEGVVSGHTYKRVRLVENDEIIIEANSNASCGYVYLVAWSPKLQREQLEDQ